MVASPAEPLFVVDRLGGTEDLFRSPVKPSSLTSNQNDSTGHYPAGRAAPDANSDPDSDLDSDPDSNSDSDNPARQISDILARTPESPAHSSSPQPPPAHKRTRVKPAPSGGPVWVDDDDDLLTVDLLQVPRRKKLRRDVDDALISASQYSDRLRNLHASNTNIRTPGSWARKPQPTSPASRAPHDRADDLKSDDGDDDEDDCEGPSLSSRVSSLLRSAGTLLSSASGKPASNAVPLTPGNLSLGIRANANVEDPCKAEARCIQFHPSGRIVLVASLDKTLRLFSVDGVHNPKLQAIHLSKFPIHSACFTRAGDVVLATSRRSFFYSVDLQTGLAAPVYSLARFKQPSWEHMVASPDGSRVALSGRRGRAVILCPKSNRDVAQISHNGPIAAMSFDPSPTRPNHLYSCTTDGTVYLWDLRTVKCIDKHVDHGVVHSTSLAASSHHYALGSDSGVVNVYKSATLSQKSTLSLGAGQRTEAPVKSFLNLTTPIHDIAFNPDGELMAFSSHANKGDVRIAHTASMSVYSNYPTAKSQLKHVCKLAFSPGGGYLAVGESSGDVRLLRLNAYPAC